jgi:GT2 family glycosyltransferase/glycosyltransferase involved in cell wall biosynthesis
VTAAASRIPSGAATSHGPTHGIRFDPAPDPLVSIVIPVHNHLDDTCACLRAIQRNTRIASFEVVVSDDGSSDQTSEILGTIKGLSLVRSDENLGFLAAISKAIAVARGKYLLMLNNDTEVQPGWLVALLDVAQSDPAVGAVGPKLMFPDGRLQEAGSIVWNDGTAWNRGSGGDPADPAFNYRREVDYCSAACLLVRRSAYEAVGGFDKRFAPGYYEDVDLCFSLHAAGYSVLYQPESIVVHQGSATYAEDPATATPGAHTKRAMEANRHIFSAKWATELDQHWPTATAMGYRGGRVSHRPRVLVIDWQVPAHDRDAGGLRMSCMIELLAELGCEVTVVPSTAQRREPYATRFQRMGVEVYYGPWVVETLVRDRAGLYDLVLLSRPEIGATYLAAVRIGFPAARLIYDTVDLHHVRERRRLDVMGMTPDAAWHSLRRLELRLMRSSDLVATVSDEEARVVSRLLPGVRTVVLPTVHDVSSVEPPGFDGRSGMVFIGGFLHDPNVDAMMWFVRDIMPTIEDAGRHLVILGSDPPRRIMALRSPEVDVTGYVEDADPYFNAAAVFVAPLRYGAGVKGKIGQAMSRGLPVVTTSIGAEGIGIIDGVHGLIRDNAESFAAAVAEVSSNRELWGRLSRAGLELVRSTLGRECMRERLRELLADTVAYRARQEADVNA